jgi:hypothetical protein
MQPWQSSELGMPFQGDESGQVDDVACDRIGRGNGRHGSLSFARATLMMIGEIVQLHCDTGKSQSGPASRVPSAGAVSPRTAAFRAA